MDQPDRRPTADRRGIRAAQFGIVVNAALAMAKLAAGIVGNTYALVADAVESTADIFGSLVVWGGLHVAATPADADHPFGHGKAEALAAAFVSLMLLGAALGISVEAVREIRTPHHTPAPWTLAVLVGVMAVKWTLARRVHAVGSDTGSTAVKADAAHHLSDAITSAAAFIGITIAVLGSRYRGGSGWESADDWAALLASAVIAFNGVSMLRASIHDLMDRMPGPDIVEPIRRAAEKVDGVRATEKLAVRKAGTAYRVTVHVQADPALPLHAAHVLGGMVKSAIRAAVPAVASVLVHMEPYDAPSEVETATMRSTRVHRRIRAPRAAVYRLLIDPAAIVRWKVPDGMSAEVHALEPVEGGAVRVSLTYVDRTREGKSVAHTDTYRGRFVRLIPNERVVEVDEFETADPDLRGEMTSTITLADAPDGGTDVVGLHENLPPGVPLADNETGWRMALAKLAALAEAGG